MKPGDASNELDVNADELASEAAAVPLPDSPLPSNAEGDAAPALDAGAASPGAEAPSSWAPITPGIISGIDLFVCPAWELTDQEKNALSDALAPALDQAFPGGLGDEKYAPWFRLLIVAGGVAAMRYDRERGRLKPLRVKAAKGANSAAPPSPNPDAEPAGPFTTLAPTGAN